MTISGPYTRVGVIPTVCLHLPLLHFILSLSVQMLRYHYNCQYFSLLYRYNIIVPNQYFKIQNIMSKGDNTQIFWTNLIQNYKGCFFQVPIDQK